MSVYFAPFIFATKNWYTLNNDRLVECTAVRQSHSIAPALCLVLAPLSHDVKQPLHINRPAVERPRVVELDDRRSAVRPPAASADVAHSLKDYQALMHRAGARQFGSVFVSSVNKL